MFTGLVEETGVVRAVRLARLPRAGGRTWQLDVEAPAAFDAAGLGASVAVDGVCLTVARRRDRVLSFDVMQETWLSTTLPKRRPGHRVNLEQALRVGDRLGGHFVTGHVDAVGVIRSRRTVRGNLEIRIAVPARMNPFFVLKGSVAVDGISLTVGALGQGAFSVHLIPVTARMTTLGAKRAGDTVNVECDMLLKRRSIAGASSS
ncbi:MAG: riboflavin synthase [Deltaproteobacteria bacterium]